MKKTCSGILVTLILTVFLSSCVNHMDMPVLLETQHFREVLGEEVYSFNDLKSSLLSIYPTMDINSLNEIMQLTGILDTTGKVQSTAISYITKDPDGSEILASGLIMRPAGRRSKGVLHFFPPRQKLTKAKRAVRSCLLLKVF